MRIGEYGVGGMITIVVAVWPWYKGCGLEYNCNNVLFSIQRWKSGIS